MGLLQRAQGLSASMETLAALGALLALRRDGAAGDPAVTARLEEIVAGIEPHLIENAPPEERGATLGFIRAFFAQAQDLLAEPGRSAGWTHTDPAILSFYGNASRQVVFTIKRLADETPWLAELLSGGRFLDIGTGVGMIAIEAAKTWPGSNVLGIDIFAPPLELARQNVAASGVADRIEFRQVGVEALGGDERFSVIWFPSPFIPEPIVRPALERLRGMLVPGGALVFGMFGAPNPEAQRLADLRVVRNGGYPWRVDGAKALLEEAGFAKTLSFAEGTLAALVVGR